MKWRVLVGMTQVLGEYDCVRALEYVTWPCFSLSSVRLSQIRGHVPMTLASTSTNRAVLVANDAIRDYSNRTPLLNIAKGLHSMGTSDVTSTTSVLRADIYRNLDTIGDKKSLSSKLLD